ncbi:SDR family NAD(P)-dependent oxidoreductase [Streptomyces gardneri]|uniref:SDR family NAD(P)-dependent oxidoreductase n=1 Tax=Streptomyces gardneri TaxID=66892 RepID=UPI0035DECFE8
MTSRAQPSVLITGASKGLGLEAARRLGEEGWRVFLGSRDAGWGREPADKLAAGGATVPMVPPRWT